MIEALKFVGAPGSAGFLAICCVIGLAAIYIWPKSRPLGRIWLLVVFAGYLALGTPVIAHALADSLNRGAVHPLPVPFSRPNTLVVFSGDNIRGRVSEALRAYKTFSPAVVIVSGEDWVVRRLTRGGIPWTRMLHDLDPTNTTEQMQALQIYLKEHPGAVTMVIASRLQAPRVAGLADAMHMSFILQPSPADNEPPREGFGRWVPRYAALRISRDAIYEHAALAYYRRNGQIR